MFSAPLKQPVQTLQRQLQQGWQWWKGQLLELCPASLKQLIQNGSRQQYLLVTHQQFQLMEQPDSPPIAVIDPTTPQRPGNIRKGASPVILIPDTLILRVPLKLPLAALDHLDTIISHQLPQLTPFERDQVHLSYQHHNDGNNLLLEIQLVPRKLIDPQLELLESLGLEVDTLRPVSLAQRGGYSLLKREAKRSWLQKTSRLLLFTNLLLATLVIALPLWQQQQQINQLESSVAEARSAAQSVLTTREALDNLQVTQQQLTALNQLPAQHLSLLVQLTETLPVTSWLSHFDWQGGTLSLRGEAENASALISLLDSLPGTADVRFTNPVTRNSSNGRERFRIQLTLQPGKDSL